MINMLLVLSIVAILVATAALIVGSMALASVIGLKNSTHQVVWKEAGPKVSADPFEAPDLEDEPEEMLVNPNKKIPKENFTKFSNEELNQKDTSFSDLDSPEVSSNFN